MTTIQTFTNGFKMIKNAQVGEGEQIQATGRPKLSVVINGEHEYTFPATSRVSKALETNRIEDVVSRLDGGHFFMKDDTLVDWRDRNYADRGSFIQEDRGIQELLNKIGFTQETKKSVGRFNNTASTEILLNKTWSDVDIHVPQYLEGGDMKSKLDFVWNPFNSNVTTSYKLERLICQNGMVGLSSLLNAKIPLVNDWEEGLNIANKLIQNKIGTMITGRMAQMNDNSMMATVRDCHRVTAMCQARLVSADNFGDDVLREKLAMTQLAADPHLHLKGVYGNEILEDMKMCDQLRSHLTLFSLWNILTDISSHTVEVKDNSNFAVQRWANEVLIDRKGVHNHISSRSDTVDVFNNVQAAMDVDVYTHLQAA